MFYVHRIYLFALYEGVRIMMYLKLIIISHFRHKRVQRLFAAGFKLCHVMRAVALYERQPLHRRGASLGALRTLIGSYLPREAASDEQAVQVSAAMMFTTLPVMSSMKLRRRLVNLKM